MVIQVDEEKAFGKIQHPIKKKHTINEDDKATSSTWQRLCMKNPQLTSHSAARGWTFPYQSRCKGGGRGEELGTQEASEVGRAQAAPPVPAEGTRPAHTSAANPETRLVYRLLDKVKTRPVQHPAHRWGGQGIQKAKGETCWGTNIQKIPRGRRMWSPAVAILTDGGSCWASLVYLE